MMFLKDYPTPKVGVRAFIFENEKILMVRHRDSKLWALPGGYADLNQTPTENIIREVKEETGYDFKVSRLLAVFDSRLHELTPLNKHLYRMVFNGEIVAGVPTINDEIDKIDYFPLLTLPPLCLKRISKKQIDILVAVHKNNLNPYFD